MPKYIALEQGYHDDVIIKAGEVFESAIKYPRTIIKKVRDPMTKKMVEKEIEVPMPNWMEAVDPETEISESMKIDRHQVLVKACKDMLIDDPDKMKVDYWVGQASVPNVKELEERTKLRKVTAEERDLAYNAALIPVSGKTKIN